MNKEDKKALLIIPLIVVSLICVVITSQNEEQQRYENCININSGGKAILQETGYFERCIIGDDK